MFFVVYGHCQIRKTMVRKYIYHFHMPLFFFISGLTFGDSDKLPFKEFFKKKFKAFIVPYIALNVVCYITRALLYHFNIFNSFGYLENFAGILYSNNKVFHLPCGSSWFLLSLFVAEIMFYFFKKYSRNDFELGIACAISGIVSYINSLSQYQIRGPWHIEATFTGVVFLFIGYIFIKNIKKFDFLFNDKWRMLFYGLIFGILGLFGSVINRSVSLDANVDGSIFLFYFNCLCTILGLICFVRVFLNHSILLKDVGKKTMIFLGYHQVLMGVINIYYPILLSTQPYMILFTVILMVIIHIVSVPVYKFLPGLVGKFKFLSKI